MTQYLLSRHKINSHEYKQSPPNVYAISRVIIKINHTDAQPRQRTERPRIFQPVNPKTKSSLRRSDIRVRIPSVQRCRPEKRQEINPKSTRRYTRVYICTCEREQTRNKICLRYFTARRIERKKRREEKRPCRHGEGARNPSRLLRYTSNHRCAWIIAVAYERAGLRRIQFSRELSG